MVLLSSTKVIWQSIKTLGEAEIRYLFNWISGLFPFQQQRDF